MGHFSNDNNSHDLFQKNSKFVLKFKLGMSTFYNIQTASKNLLDRELCHSTSKPIGDEEDIFKSFMGFDVTPRRPIFKVVVVSVRTYVLHML